jgi:hypothetical protein
MERSPLPDRILSFSASPSGDCLVKIIETNDIEIDDGPLEMSGKYGKYASLSHRWGVDRSFITTTANLDDRRQGIPWTDLPRTFQEAILYCLELGISYLWVDALCILQDDSRDWEIQSQKMADIYYQSFITLGTTWSDGTHDGLFPPEQSSRVGKLIDIPEVGSGLRVRRGIPHWSRAAPKHTMTTDPLLSRAWVFQERLLSTRFLHFSLHEMIWECAGGLECECGGLYETMNLKRQFALAAKLNDQTVAEERHQEQLVSREKTQQSEQEELDPDFDELDDELGARVQQRREVEDRAARRRAEKRRIKFAPIKEWHGIVEQYSTLALTDQADRLPALSGLAGRISTFLGTYLAGLWSSSILADLAWKADRQPDEPSRAQSYLGPSWSWVSVTTGVQFLYSKEESSQGQAAEVDTAMGHRRAPRRVADGSSFNARRLAARDKRKRAFASPRIVSVRVKTDGQNRYGKVSAGALVVNGMLRPARRCSGVCEVEIDLSPTYSRIMPTLRLPFYEDSSEISQAEPGGSRISEPSDVFLFALYPRICLVLVKSTTTAAVADLDARAAKLMTYRRVGILELAESIETMSGLDWLDGATREEFTMI